MSTLTVLGIFLAIVLLAGWSYYSRSEALLKKYNAKTHFSAGRYVTGLGADGPIDDIECVVTRENFIFANLSGKEFGRIPTNCVKEVLVDDKSRIAQRLTVTRMVAFGVFALAVPKRKKIKEWCVAIQWTDDKGYPRAAVFEFTGKNPEGDANKVANMLMRYMGPKKQNSEPTVLAVGESRICPFCAETIKAAAVICRFCNRELRGSSP
jgi:hypothetical protein